MTARERKLSKLSRIYVFGNPSVKEDSLPIRLLPRLKEKFNDIDFVEIDPTENLPEEENFVIIDTIINSDKIKIIKDIDKIKTEPNYSLHDFDLGFNLKLMKKLGKVRDITIIGIPVDIREDEALMELRKVITSSLSKNGLHS